MDRPTLAEEFLRAVTVAIADVPIRLAQDYSQCDAWAGRAGFTSDLLQYLNPLSRELTLPASLPLPEHLPRFDLKSQPLPRVTFHAEARP
jgi:hypothetical protein